MKLKHFAIFFVILAILAYFIFMLVRTDAVTAVDTAEDVAKKTDATAELVTENKTAEIEDSVKNNGAKPDEPASKQQKLETYFKLLDEAALMPEVAKQLPDYKKILTNIYTHGVEPTDDEFAKLDLLYSDLRAIRMLEALPEKIRYAIEIYRQKEVTLPDDWQEMSDYGWIDFISETRISRDQMRLMLKKGLNPNKMLSSYGGTEEHSLLYAIVDARYSTIFIKILLNAGANPNLTDAKKTTLPLDKAFELKTFDVATLLIEYGAIGTQTNYQASFDKIMQEIIEFGFTDIDVPKTLLTLEGLIKLGANPNTQVGYAQGDTYYVMTPISGLLELCVQDDWPDENKDRSFYLDMMKLLVNEDTDWNAKNIYDYYHYDDDEDGSSTIADILKWVEKEMKADKSPYRDYDTSHCIEVVDYVKNYLKENNITIE